MSVFVLLGPPGSGKGTQARLLSQVLGGASFLGMGELLRQELIQKTSVGRSVQAAMDAGQLVDSALTMEILHKNWPTDSTKDVILDGVPRNMEQVRDLENLFKEMAFTSGITRVFSFLVPEKMLVSRLLERLSCVHCGVPYSTRVRPEDIVSNCTRLEGHKFLKRSDDLDAAIQKRLAVHEENTQQVIEHYRPILVKIDGTQKVQEVHQEILGYCEGRI